MKPKYIIVMLLALLMASCTIPGGSNSNSGDNSDSLTSDNGTPPRSQPGDSSSSSSNEMPSSHPSVSEPTPGNTQVISNTRTINIYQKDAFSETGLPSLGSQEVLVVPVEISGTPFDANYKTNIEKTFNGTSAETGWESVSSYYTKSSYGRFDLSFRVLDKITTSNNKSYYENRNIGSGEDTYNIGDEYAIVDVFSKINGVDMADYDTNNDGHIDAVIFVYSVSYADSDPWWAWVYRAQYFSQNSVPFKNGKALSYYMWASYSFMHDDTLAQNVALNAETYIHEMGHLLAFPDLYHQDYNYGAVGGFDMMDYNRGDHGPLNKILWGWVDPLLLPTGGTYDLTLPSYSLSSTGAETVLLIPRPGASFTTGNLFQEYILLIYYTPNGLYDGHLGIDSKNNLNSSGVVIYHIDARLHSSANSWDFFRNDNQAGTSNFIIEILEADKNNSLPSNSTGLTMNDLLRSGTLDLSYYAWNQSGYMNTSVTINSLNQASADLKIVVA